MSNEIVTNYTKPGQVERPRGRGAVGRGQGEVSNAPQIFAELEAQFVKTSLPVIF